MVNDLHHPVLNGGERTENAGLWEARRGCGLPTESSQGREGGGRLRNDSGEGEGRTAVHDGGGGAALLRGRDDWSTIYTSQLRN